MLLALHFRIDRQAEGRRSYPRRSEIDRRSLRQALSRHHRKRRLLLGGEIVLRLWAWQRADVPTVGGRNDGAAGATADAGTGGERSDEARGYRVLRGADFL